MEDEIISTGWHWSYGWLRRPEEDKPFGFCYEDGDGDLIYSIAPPHRKQLYLTCCRDRESGTKYLRIHASTAKVKK